MACIRGFIITNRERENATLSFQKPLDRGPVEETFFPWTLSLNRWKDEGLPINIADGVYSTGGREIRPEEVYIHTVMAGGVYEYERYLGFDGIKRLFFNLPFLNFETKTIDETEDYIIKQEFDGWQRKHYKNRDLIEEHRPVICCKNDWELLKQKAVSEIEKYYSDENFQSLCGIYKERHENGDFSVRIGITGFFWTPRTLLGIEQHLLAYYDYPEMLHDMNRFILEVYYERLGKMLDILPADVLYIMEDLSGANGPMISPALFDEFVGSYYRQLVPFLKSKGVGHIFVDTDGDFNILIPNFIETGIEGFLPMDVNAGMDIVAVRQKYPMLKFIGAFNKLKIAQGQEAIDSEFERLLPVIRQGGYIPGCDHQVAPSTPFENYLFYIDRLKEVMKEAGKDLT